MSDVEFTMDAKLYEPIAGESGPCGPSLSHDERFGEFRAAGAGRPERYDPVLGKEIPAEPPNWQSVVSLGTELTARSKDVAILAPLVNAMAATRGAEGAASALHLLSESLVAYWSELHPVADEDGDYFERMAILRGLSGGGTLAKSLETAPVHTSRRAGAITLRTLSIAAGETIPRGSETVFDPDQLTRLFEDEKGAAEAAAKTRRAAEEARAHLQAIAEFVSGQEGAGRIAFTDAEAVLGRLATLLAPFAGEEEAAAEAQVESAQETVAPTHALDDIADRDEALALIDSLIRWYADNARSSPVPLILLKIRNLIGADFAAVVDAVAPKGWDNAALKLGDIDGAALDSAPSAGAAAPAPNGGGGGAARQPALDAVFGELDALDAAIAARSAAAEPASESAAESASDDSGGDAEEKAPEAAETPPDDCADLRAAAERLRAELGKLRDSAAADATPDSPGTPSVQIRNRGDVAQAIERLSKHFSTHEPSSPVSGFLLRANSFVNRGFVDIVKELAPQGRANAELRLTQGSSPQSGQTASGETKEKEA